MRSCIQCGALCQGARCPAHQRPRAAHKVAYNDTRYRKARKAARGAVCALCGLPGADSMGHVLPLVRGGLNVPSNWQPEHLVCPVGRTGNLRKGAR